MKATYPVVPDRNRVRLPVEARLEVGVLGELVEEELEDGVRLRLRDADDAAGEAWEVAWLADMERNEEMDEEMKTPNGGTGMWDEASPWLT